MFTYRRNSRVQVLQNKADILAESESGACWITVRHSAFYCEPVTHFEHRL